jgi:hypothetical protein
MVKSFLILMLMTTQLLAGSRESLYVCIRGDGSFCCLDVGENDCAHCEAGDEEVATVETEIIASQPSASPEIDSTCGCCCNEAKLTSSELTSSELTSSEEVEAEGVSPNDSDRHIDSVVAIADPCGCTQYLISHNQTTTCIAQSVPTWFVCYLIQSAIETPAHGGDVAADADCSAFHRFRPPLIASQAITVLSWVLIQC